MGPASLATRTHRPSKAKGYEARFTIHVNHTQRWGHLVLFGSKLGIDADGDLKVTKQ